MNSLARTSLFSAAVVVASVGLGLGVSCTDQTPPPPPSMPMATPDLAPPTVEPDLAVPDVPTPTLTMVSPASGPTGGGVLVTLKGTRFAPGATVSFGGTPATMVKVVSDTQLEVTLPAKPGAFGKVAVTVNLQSGKSATLADAFSYYASNVSFSAPSFYAVGSDPVGLEFADLNGDKKLDAIVTNSGSDNISVLLGKGGGTFEAAASSPVAAQPMAVKSTDLNGDKKLDLVVACAYDNVVSVLLGKGDGTFAAPANIAVPQNPQAILVGDFTGDGKDDVVTASYDKASISVLTGKGDGTFGATAQSTPVGSRPLGLAAIDLNGDKKLDLLVTNSGAGTLSILLGKGDGTFDVKSQDVGQTPFAVAIADLNENYGSNYSGRSFTTCRSQNHVEVYCSAVQSFPRNPSAT